jgi:hypothetical protein
MDDDPKIYWQKRLNDTADALNKIRMTLCAYMAPENGMCDCKYGAPQGIPSISSEKTGCPELRQLVRAYRELANNV